jgi:hypothetical protein
MGVAADGFGILSTNNHAPSLASVFSGGVLAAFSVSIPLQRGLGVLLSARRDLQDAWWSWVYEFIVKEKEERHIDGFPVSGDSTVIVERCFSLEQIRCSPIYWVHGAHLGWVQANKDISWSDGLLLIFYLMTRWDMAGWSWLLLVRRESLRVLGLVRFRFAVSWFWLAERMLFLSPVFFTTGCILGLALVRWFHEIPQGAFYTWFVLCPFCSGLAGLAKHHEIPTAGCGVCTGTGGLLLPSLGLLSCRANRQMDHVREDMIWRIRNPTNASNPRSLHQIGPLAAAFFVFGDLGACFIMPCHDNAFFP